VLLAAESSRIARSLSSLVSDLTRRSLCDGSARAASAASRPEAAISSKVPEWRQSGSEDLARWLDPAKSSITPKLQIGPARCSAERGAGQRDLWSRPPMREPTVSIITALADRPAPRLPEIHAVLAAVPDAWEWLLQLDGDGDGPRTLPPAIADDPRVAVERNGRQLGIAATRNRALARARGPLLLNVDSDDLPREAAFSALAPVFADPSLGLAFGDWVEHWPDRAPWTSSVRFAPGRVAPGTLSRIWGEERWGADAPGGGDVAHRCRARRRWLDRDRRGL